MKLQDIFLRATAILGFVIFAFFCLSKERAIGICFAGIVTVLIFKYRDLFSGLVNSINKHPYLYLLLIFVLGVVERVLIFKLSPFALGEQKTDYSILWNAAQQVSEGCWPLSKSWMTVILFGISSKMFGHMDYVAWLTAGGLQILTSIASFMMLRKTHSTIAGLFVSAIIFLSPVFAIDTFHVSTEHAYALFIMLALYSAFTNRLVIAEIFALLAMWSRAEGVLLVVLIPTWALIISFYFSNITKHLLYQIVASVVIVSFGFFSAIKINDSMGQTPSIFCSSDNMWPRLMGSNVETKGAFCVDDCVLIWEKYKSMNPDVDWEMSSDEKLPIKMCGQCPPEVVPLIQEEIKNRWTQMPIMTAITHILTKEIIDWNSNVVNFNHERGTTFIAVAAYALLFPCFVILGCLIFLFLFLRDSIQGRHIAFSTYWILVIIPFLLGNFVLLSIVESMGRYGFALHLMCPIMAAAGYSMLFRKGDIENQMVK